MNVRAVIAFLGCLAVATAFGGSAARADTNPLSYDDPGMHFLPGAGWERVPIEPSGPAPGLDHPLAVYVFHRGKIDQRTVVVAAEEYEGNLDGYERSHESNLRSQNDGVFIDKHEAIKLDNGMPAYWLKSSQGSEVGKYLRRYEVIVFDGRRAIVVSYMGRQGDFEEKEARDALSSLYVVAFPHGRS
jgi:hypothetical protein